MTTTVRIPCVWNRRWHVIATRRRKSEVIELLEQRFAARAGKTAYQIAR